LNSTCTPEFWQLYNALPEDIRALTLKNHLLWQQDPQHPSLHFKCLEDNVWSVRIGIHYRALGEIKGDQIRWFWIGTHSEYNHRIR